ncbi:hypothetical protein [Roseateles albus]|uniref:Uncharacterized protein n=1 Tax=Roseateles albus TaxID=2987525 RepID=A0ABT5KEK0_9BURK|nr:hypothetical protein [Roseateles albus]MDC8772357.1 hypothetical protein [Roseateles albus]
MTFSIKKLSFDGKRFIQKPPPLKRSRKCFVAACAAMALGMACNAQANVWITPSPVDTITTLVINWGWDSAGGTETYFGKSWNATITTTEVGSTWTVNTWYQHLDGPHGEAHEPMHSHSISFLEPDGGGSGRLCGRPTQAARLRTSFSGWHPGKAGLHCHFPMSARTS